MTEFQLNILKLNFIDFCNLTNIRDLVTEEYRKRLGNKSIPGERIEKGIEFYFNRRNEFGKWNNSCLKLLRFKDNSLNLLENQTQKMVCMGLIVSKMNSIEIFFCFSFFIVIAEAIGETKVSQNKQRKTRR